jgi:predicted ATP-grasp superfamily ATP-dependent carboligase
MTDCASSCNVPTSTVDEPKVAEPAIRLLEAVGFTGIVEVEFKTDSRDGQYKVLNVNPRVSVEQCRFVNAAKSPLDPRQPEADVRASAFH